MYKEYNWRFDRLGEMIESAEKVDDIVVLISEEKQPGFIDTEYGPIEVIPTNMIPRHSVFLVNRGYKYYGGNTNGW